MTQLGENIRINVELIDGENNSTLWGETYTRPRSALYEIEETLSEEIADALGIQLTGEEEGRLATRYTENSDAHHAYLKGMAERAKFRIEGTEKAVQYFEEATRKDPNYALAYAALANAYYLLGQPLAGMPKGEAMPKVEELAMKALEIDNSLGEAHVALGWVRLHYDWDWKGSEEEFSLALKLDPNSVDAHSGKSWVLTTMGQFDEAISWARRALQLDPLSLTYRALLAEHLYIARRYDEAIKELQIVLEMNPNFHRAYLVMEWVYEAKGMYQEAARVFQKERILRYGANEEEVAGLSDAAASGAKDYWRWRLTYYREREKRGENVIGTHMPMIHGYLGEMDQAFKWLEQEYDTREGDIWGLKVYPWYDPLRDDPRFHDLLRRMNLEP
jgi:tetratricopeptide (TPR) repeat protein